MSADFNATPQDNPTTNESETPMFSGVPSWERNRKRGLFGGKSRAAEPAGEPMDDRPAMILDEPTAAHADTVDAPSDAFAGAPAYASRTVKKRGSAAPIAIAAGIIAIGGLAAAGWYATQPHEAGVAQLTPGTETTTAAAAVSPPPPEMAANTAPTRAPDEAAEQATPVAPAKAVTPPARTTTRMATARTRPAPVSRSAEEAGVNTSATLPAAPQPYSSTTTTPAPADTTTVSPPAEAAPPPVNAGPAPTQAAPSPDTSPAAATPPVATPPQ
jgi:hypothetical protein